MRKLGLSSLLLLLLMTPSARSQKNKPSAKKPAVQPRMSAWVESTLKKMTLREKIGQMLMPYYFGVFTSTESAEYKELLHQVEENHVGGFIVGTDRGPLGIERSQVYPTAVHHKRTSTRSKIPLLIGADFESGTGMRLDEGTSFPSAMAIGATGDPKLAYTAGKIIALEARAAGVHWIFAPDADVNNNPDNPIINIRSFGEDPQKRRRVRHAVHSRRRRKRRRSPRPNIFPAMATSTSIRISRWPRFPATARNSTALSWFPSALRLLPALVRSCRAILSVPALEPDPHVPATLSRNILTGLLREEMKFKGLIVTDAMDMGGVTLFIRRAKPRCAPSKPERTSC